MRGPSSLAIRIPAPSQFRRRRGKTPYPNLGIFQCHQSQHRNPHPRIPLAAVPCAVCRVLPLAGVASAFSRSGAACSVALAEWRWRVRGRSLLDGVGLVPWWRLRQHVFCVLQRRGCNRAPSRRRTREHHQTTRCPPRTKTNAPAVLPQPPPSSLSVGRTRTQPHGFFFHARITPPESPESPGSGVGRAGSPF